MRWTILLTLVISNLIASISKSNDYYDFLQPLIVNLDINQSNNSNSREKLLSKFDSLAKLAPRSNELYYLNYKLMQDFQYQLFHISIEKNNKYTMEEKNSFYKDKYRFIEILKSIKEPSFFTLYSQLYLETLDSKRLQHKSVIKLYSLSNSKQYPYVQLLSYLNSLNQLNSISITNQNNLHKKLTLLLLGLPKKQQEYTLRLTAQRLLPLYDKNSIEFIFNKLFAQKSHIKREDILHVLNFKDADLFKEYIMKEKRSFFEERVFKTTMQTLRRNDIAMILSILYMQKDNYDEARSAIRQTPRNNLYSKYNPFSSSVEPDNKKVYKKSSSLRKFAETMSRLEKRIEKGSKKTRDYYLYGNGLYNKSCFGNFPLSSVFFQNKNILKSTTPHTCNLEKARQAYEHAFQLSIDEQFKAEISYQLLKIEFNIAMINSNNYINKMPKLTDRKEVIHLLKSSRGLIEAVKDYKLDYAQTEYGKKVIEESILFTYLEEFHFLF